MGPTEQPTNIETASLASSSEISTLEYISDLSIITSNDSSVPPPLGFTKIPQDLNAGAGGDYVYLCYKTGNSDPITAIFISSFDWGFYVSSELPGYTIIKVDLNQEAGGRFIWLYYSRLPELGPPISNLVVTKSDQVFAGYKLILQDLNEGAGGETIRIEYLAQGSFEQTQLPQWDPTHTFISSLEVITSDEKNVSAPPGYIRIEQDLNEGAGGDYVYLCYKRGEIAPITALWVGSFGFTERVDIPGYERIDVDLNSNAGGRYIYLYYSKLPQLGAPISDLIVSNKFLLGGDMPDDLKIVWQDLNEGAGGEFVRLGYKN